MKNFTTPPRLVLALASMVLILWSWRVGAHPDEVSQYPDLGKIKELARDEIEFRLPSTEIRGFALSDFIDYKSVLLIGADSQRCGDDGFLKELTRLQANFEKKKELKIVLLDSAVDARRDEIAKKLAALSKGRPLTYLFDALQTVSKSLDFKTSRDYVLIDPVSLKISERGGMASDTQSADSVPDSKLPKALLASIKKSEACDLRYETVHLEDFKEDFLRPFTRACQSCHVGTQVHDHFKTLDQVLGWRAMSLRTIRLMRMPGRYDPYYYQYRSSQEKYDVFHEPSNEDLRKVVAWLSQPPKITSKMKKAFVDSRESTIRSQKKSYSGYPVLMTVEMDKPVQVPAEGTALYKNTYLGEPLKEDLVLQGLFLRTNLSVVHHTTIFAFDPKKVDATEFENSVNMDYHHRQWVLREKFYGKGALKSIDGTLDGKKAPFIQIFEPVVATFSRRDGPMLFPDDAAIVIKKGMRFAVQLHMEPSGKVESVPLSFDVLGRPFSKPFSLLRRISLNPDNKFEIRPGQSSYIVSSFAKFAKRSLLKTITIHTHYRGIAARIRLKTPSGREKIVASLPFMQMKTDRRLNLLRGGLEIEAGSTIITEVEYDNSERNPSNPDPEATVKLGGRIVEDDMYYPRYIYIELDTPETKL